MATSEIIELGDKFKPNLLPLNSKSPPPPLFNGTPRLYISLTCPYSQRVWIARNFKGLENIELIPINLVDKPEWYLKKISAAMKVPALEHNGRVKVESLEILQYMENNFNGPKLFPQVSPKWEATSELLRNVELMNQRVFLSLKSKDLGKSNLDNNIGPLFDQLELALARFSVEGPYLLGSISMVDFVYVPFIERFNILLQELFHYNIFERRPRLFQWLAALNELGAYTSTKVDNSLIIEDMRKSLGR